jgi:hypothetical protein
MRLHDDYKLTAHKFKSTVKFIVKTEIPAHPDNMTKPPWIATPVASTV